MIRRITSVSIVLLCTIALAQTKPSSPDEEGPWHKIKSAQGHTKNKPVVVKFQPGTAKWRVTISSTADKDDKDRPNPSSSIRVALMTETQRDVEGKPVNWAPSDVLIEHAKPGASVTKTYNSGLTKDGKEKWFQLVITGYLAEYDLTVEDQSADDSAKSKSKSKKKKDDDE